MRPLKALRSIKTLLTALLVLIFIQALSAQTVDKIVAIVNDEIIAQSDVNKVFAAIEAEYRAIYSDREELSQKLKEIKENIISQMVEEKLVLSEAKRYNIEADENKIEERLEQIKAGFSGEEEFERTLNSQGLTVKDLRDRFADQEVMKKAVAYFVRSKVKVNPLEISQFYQERQEEIARPQKAHLDSIMIKVDESGNEYQALEKARRLLERLKKGESFEGLAKAYSQGGPLGVIEQGQLIKEIDEVVFALAPGEFSDVIKTASGYRIFKLEKKEPKQKLTFEEAQESIRSILYEQKFSQEFKKWIDELKSSAYIVIKSDD